MERWTISEKFQVKVETRTLKKKDQISWSKIAEISELQLGLKIFLKQFISSLLKNYEIQNWLSATWSWKDKGVAPSWEWQAYFSWYNFSA